MKKGKMSSEGIMRYLEGKAKKPHDAEIPKNPRIPEYLRKEIEKNNLAEKNFKKIPPSYKRTLLRWFLRAKLNETKKRRAKIIIQSLKKNEKLFPAA